MFIVIIFIIEAAYDRMGKLIVPRFILVNTVPACRCSCHMLHSLHIPDAVIKIFLGVVAELHQRIGLKVQPAPDILVVVHSSISELANMLTTLSFHETINCIIDILTLGCYLLASIKSGFLCIVKLMNNIANGIIY